MADTPKQRFARISGISPVAAIPEFPKLPEALRRKLSEEDRKELDEWDNKVKEFFKQERTRSL